MVLEILEKNSRFWNFFSEILNFLKILKIMRYNFQSRKHILTLRGVYLSKIVKIALRAEKMAENGLRGYSTLCSILSFTKIYFIIDHRIIFSFTPRFSIFPSLALFSSMGQISSVTIVVPVTRVTQVVNVVTPFALTYFFSKTV